jgi:hypothetical protein
MQEAVGKSEEAVQAIACSIEEAADLDSTVQSLAADLGDQEI